MCRLAFSFSPRITVSDMEIRREGRSYTADTLEALKTPKRELSFLCGTDMLLSMDTWYDPARIFRLATVVCMRRETDPQNTERLLSKAEEYRLRFGAKVKFLMQQPVILSSSDIRERLARGEDCSAYLDASVSDYILERGLYR